jgi:hypothetical protein
MRALNQPQAQLVSRRVVVAQVPVQTVTDSSGRISTMEFTMNGKRMRPKVDLPEPTVTRPAGFPEATPIPATQR